MAYGQPPQYPPQEPMPAPGPKPRPGTVTFAVWTQFLTAIALVATALSLFVVASEVEDIAAENNWAFERSGDDEVTIVSGAA
jgi:hypothetical protein